MYIYIIQFILFNYYFLFWLTNIKITFINIITFLLLTIPEYYTIYFLFNLFITLQNHLENYWLKLSIIIVLKALEKDITKSRH